MKYSKISTLICVSFLCTNLYADNPFNTTVKPNSNPSSSTTNSNSSNKSYIEKELEKNNIYDSTNSADYNIKFYKETQGITPVFIDDNSEHSFDEQRQRFYEARDQAYSEAKGSSVSAERNKEREDLIKNNPELFGRVQESLNNGKGSNFGGDTEFSNRVKSAYEYSQSIAEQNIKSGEQNGSITYIEGDTKLACHAVMCMSSGGGTEETIGECTEAMARYESIVRPTVLATIVARQAWLNKCPTADDKGNTLPF